MEAHSALGRQLVGEYARRLGRWFAETPEWIGAARRRDSSEQWFELTPDELRELGDEVLAVPGALRGPAQAQGRAPSGRVVRPHAFPERRDAT